MAKKKTQSVKVLTSIEATRLSNPLFNGWKVGHGVHGKTKYDRRQSKKDLQKELREEGGNFNRML